MTRRADLSLPDGAYKRRSAAKLQTASSFSDASDFKTPDLIEQVNVLYAAQKYRGAPLKHWMAKQLRLVLDGKMSGYDHLTFCELSQKERLTNLNQMLANLAPLHADYVETQRKHNLKGTTPSAAGKRSGEVRKDRGAEKARGNLAAHPQGKTARQLAKMVVAEQLFSDPEEKRRALAAITRFLKRHGVST